MWLAQVFGDPFVRKEDPINVGPEDNIHSEPEPDLAVMIGDVACYAKSHPYPSDIRLLVEVADTTPSFDRTTKARLYARADIADYWIANIQSRRIIIHRDPVAGEYRSVIAYAAHEKVAPLAAAQAELLVGEVFPL